MTNNIIKGNVDYINTEFMESELPLKFCNFENAGESCRGIQRRVESNKSDTGYEDVRYTRYSVRIPEDARIYCGIEAKFYYKEHGGIYIVDKRYIDERTAKEKYKSLFKFMDKAYKVCFPDEITIDEYTSKLGDKDEIKKKIHKNNLDTRKKFIEAQDDSLRCIYDYEVDPEDYGNFIVELKKHSKEKDLISNKYDLIYFVPNSQIKIKMRSAIKSILGDVESFNAGVGYSFVEKDKPKAINIISLEKNCEKLYYVALSSINRIGEPTLLEGKMLLDIDKVDIMSIEECPDRYKNIIGNIADYTGVDIGDKLGLSHSKDVYRLYTSMDNISYNAYKISF